MARSTNKDVGILDIPELEVGKAEVFLLGTQPLIFNRMALKARQQLLFPSSPKTRAEKEATMKHDPISEFRDSVSRRRPGDDGPTRLVFPSPAIKGAMATACLDLPGTTKARINRLTWVSGQSIPIWGRPELFMSVVRNSDPGRTPDVRTRAALPRWCTKVTLQFVSTLIKPKVIASLVGASGIIVGIGDFRQEKGKGNYGTFEVVSEDDPRLAAIMKEGTKVQDEALENPAFFDADSEDLFTWFEQEKITRGVQRQERAAAKEQKEAAKLVAAEAKQASASKRRSRSNGPTANA